MSSWKVNIFNSLGASNAIAILHPQNSPKGHASIPSEKYDERFSRVSSSELIGAWLKRVANNYGDPFEYLDKCSINDNFILTGHISWENKIIKSCNLQALITTNGTTLDLFTDNNTNAIQTQYYRLDYTPDKPGPLFKEPLLHIHCIPDGSPRFSLSIDNDIFLPLRFIEFIFLNHFHDDWCIWTKAIADAIYPSVHLEQRSQMDALTNAFNDGTLWVNKDKFKTSASKLKEHLRKEKEKYTSLKLNLDPDIDTFSYPI